MPGVGEPELAVHLAVNDAVVVVDQHLLAAAQPQPDLRFVRTSAVDVARGR